MRIGEREQGREKVGREGRGEGEQLGTWMDFGNGRGLVSPGPPPRPSPSLAPTLTASLGWPPEALPDLCSPPAVEYVWGAGGWAGGRGGGLGTGGRAAIP